MAFLHDTAGMISIIRSIFLLAIFSCGEVKKLVDDMVTRGDEAVRIHSVTDAAFATYVERFEKEGKKYKGNNFAVGDIPINFGDTEKDSRVGVCFTYPADKYRKEIIIKESWWSGLGKNGMDQESVDLLRESLIFHELGHCRLGRVHSNEEIKLKDQMVKSSLMSNNIVSASVYRLYREPYLRELFRESKDGFIEEGSQ